jgi:hypothetical protein
MGSFMHDQGSNQFGLRLFIEDEPLVELAGIKRGVEACNGVGKQFHPDAVEVANETIMCDSIVGLDQPKRRFHTGPAGRRLALESPDPQSIDAPPPGKAEQEPVLKADTRPWEF